MEAVVKAPDMVYTLTLATGLWTAAPLFSEPGAEPLVEIPDFDAKRDALLDTLGGPEATGAEGAEGKGMGVPGVLARAMCRPKTEFEDWSAGGEVSGDVPCARKKFVISIMDEKIYLYGGCDAKETVFYDGALPRRARHPAA